MKNYYRLIQGDCIRVMPSLEDDSVDCVVTDPPYGIKFMGKSWDRALPPKQAFQEMFRVLKPGALAFVMSSPRQDVLWRMMSLLEGVGFELKQSPLYWAYASGFPKAYDVSKGIDKRPHRSKFDDFKEYCNQQRKSLKLSLNNINELGNWATTGGGVASNVMGNKIHTFIPSIETYHKLKGILKLDDRFDTLIEEAEREIIGKGENPISWGNDNPIHKGGYFKEFDLTESKTDLAKRWDGWKSQTGLKPAVEVILMVNKPRSEKTIVDQVLKTGTGAVNVDACRIPFDNPQDDAKRIRHNKEGSWFTANDDKRTIEKGRFPANLLVSNDVLDTGKTSKSGKLESHHIITSDKTNEIYGKYSSVPAELHTTYGDDGGFSRYFSLDAWFNERVKRLPIDVQKTLPFLIVPKASKGERDEGLEDLRKQRESVGIRYKPSETIYVLKNPPEKEDISQYLKSWRLKKGLSQAEIDKLMNWNTKYSWLEGRKSGLQLTTPENWLKLKNILFFDDIYDKQMTELKEVNRAEPTFKESMPRRNIHPTVKPLKLKSYLVELGCPKGGVVLDPFVGQGTTLMASYFMGKSCIGIDINAEYCGIADAKAKHFMKQKSLDREIEYSFELAS